MATTAPRALAPLGAPRVRRSHRVGRLGNPVGYVDPGADDLRPSSHLWLLGWLLAASLGAVVISPPESSLAIWWPATFVGVGLLLQAPRRQWVVLVPVVAGTITLGQVLAERQVDLSIGMGLLTALESLVIALVLRGLPGSALLTSVSAVGRLLLADLAGAVVFAAGLAPLMVFLPEADYLELVGQTTLSHVTAALCLGPLFLTPAGAWRRSREQYAQWAVLVAVELWVFGTASGAGVAVALLPVLLWGAVRQSPRATAIQSTVVAVVAVLAFSVGRGPFTVGVGGTYPDWTAATIALQLYLSALALTALVVATASAQQRDAAEAARREADFTRTVLRSTDALTAVVAADGTVLLVNDAVTRATGFSAAHLEGRPIWETLTPPENRALAQQAFAEGLRLAEADLSGERELATTSGKVRRVRLTASAFDTGPGEPGSVVLTGIDVTDERHTGDLLARMLEAGSSTATIGLDPDGTITVFSRGAVDLLGLEADDALGAAFTTLIARGTCDGSVVIDPAASPAAETARILDVLGTGPERPAHDWWWECADGERVAVSQTLDEVTDGAGRRTGYLVVARDVTERRRSQEILLAALQRERQAVDRLRSLDRAKNEFVTTVSHELRTPISSIVGYAEVVREEVTDDATRCLLDAIARNGYRLRDLANDLVTLSDLEQGGATDTGPVDLRTQLQGVLADLSPTAHTRCQSLVFQDLLDETTPCRVQGDREHVRRALGNVVDNALKFSPDGAEVTVCLEPHEDGIRVRVSDQGMGIPADEVEHVFQRFYRARNANEHAIQGPGLGLSLAETILRLHGGELVLRSTEGAGTQVDVVFPQQRQLRPGPLRSG
ncbi:PAS domain S-box protein [Nocardioidaceae bacterium]|nr:PAS domain S-box protein [Nocardioidaceae bacterium]